MSVRTMARVWADSKHSGTELLMLLAIADFADDDGNAYPSVPTLAAKCRTTPRNANRVLTALRASGELEIRLNEGPRGTNRYRVAVQGMTPASPLTKSSPLTQASGTPDVDVPNPLTQASDEPSLNHQEPSVERRSSRARKNKKQNFGAWYSATKAEGEKLIGDNDPIHDYSRKVGIPDEFVQIGWEVFKRDHLDRSDKVQADWRATFRQYVRKGWLKVWRFDQQGKCVLTDAGLQAAREHGFRSSAAGDPFADCQ